MRSAEYIEKLLSRFYSAQKNSAKTNAEIDNKILADAIAEYEKTNQTQSAIKLNKWRIIMNSRITKLTTAAVLLLAVGLSIIFVDQSATPAYAISDLPILFSQASSLHFKGCIYTHKNGDQRPFEYWIDIERAKSRQKHIGVITNGNETTTTELEDIFDGKQLVHINHTEKTVKYEYASEFYKNYSLRRNVDAILKQTLDTIMQVGDFVNVGKETIENVNCQIWQGQFLHPANKNITIKAECWLDPKNGDLCKMRIWYKMLGEKDFNLGFELLEAERNIEIDDLFFTFEPISGYQYENTPETASKAKVPYTSSWYNHNIGLTIYTSFKLKNGSVILCWKCQDDRSEQKYISSSQSTFAGQIPQTPVSIIDLQSVTANGLGPVYYGKQLASIKFENDFCQWSIYIPQENNCQDAIAYSMVQKVNDEALKDKWNHNLTLTPEITIDNQQDFENLVIAAMAELSEDGVIPPEITYEKVLDLASD